MLHVACFHTHACEHTRLIQLQCKHRFKTTKTRACNSYDALRRVPVLFALSDRQLWAAARLLKPVDFARGAAVFRAGDAADAFYVVRSGSFTIFKGAVFAFIYVFGEGGCGGGSGYPAAKTMH
jgi:hypothetical protein